MELESGMKLGCHTDGQENGMENGMELNYCEILQQKQQELLLAKEEHANAKIPVFQQKLEGARKGEREK